MLNGEINGRSTGRNAIGFYTEREAFLKTVEVLNGCGDLYLNLNRLLPDLLGRAANEFKPWAKLRFTDAEVVRRRAILVDCAPVRPGGINSTDTELAAAVATADRIGDYLFDRWDVEPFLMKSGNGTQLIYLIDEPSDTLRVKSVLEHLANQFSDASVKVDTAVSDAARITRVPGTLNCKGDDIPGRPRRYAEIVSVPAERRVVTTEQLDLLASPRPKIALAPRSYTASDETLARLSKIAVNGIENDGSKRLFAVCCRAVEMGLDDVATLAAVRAYEGIHPFPKNWTDNEIHKRIQDARQKTQPVMAAEPMLAINDELRLARNVVSIFSAGEVPTIRYFECNWYEWRGTWRRINEGDFAPLLYDICKKYLIENSSLDRPAPKFTISNVSNVMLALRSIIRTDNVGWIDGRGGRWIAFADKLLNLDAWIGGEVVCDDQTPEFFAPTALNYPLTYTEAEPTILIEKLRDQMSESELLVLQEFGGYCMTAETDIQRILYMVGPPRSFKGTYERVVRHTIGEHNAVSKTFSSFLGAHALENLPSKTLLAISDSRPDPKLSRQAVERLLSISGQDPQDINPKGKTPYTTTLSSKIAVMSNIIADFADPTGALSSRFLFVATTKSYAANPDPKLLDRILEQQNEITWWFLRGLRRLLQNGRYTETNNELRKRFQLQNDPISSFIAEYCDVTGNVNDKMPRDVLHNQFDSWCADNQIMSLELT